MHSEMEVTWFKKVCIVNACDLGFMDNIILFFSKSWSHEYCIYIKHLQVKLIRKLNYHQMARGSLVGSLVSSQKVKDSKLARCVHLGVAREGSEMVPRLTR